MDEAILYLKKYQPLNSDQIEKAFINAMLDFLKSKISLNLLSFISEILLREIQNGNLGIKDAALINAIEAVADGQINVDERIKHFLVRIFNV